MCPYKGIAVNKQSREVSSIRIYCPLCSSRANSASSSAAAATLRQSLIKKQSSGLWGCFGLLICFVNFAQGLRLGFTFSFFSWLQKHHSAIFLWVYGGGPYLGSSKINNEIIGWFLAFFKLIFRIVGNKSIDIVSMKKPMNI